MSRSLLRGTSVALALAALAAPATARADAPPAAEARAPSRADAAPHRGALLLGGKAGGLLPFSSLSPFVSAGVELGWVFPAMNRSFGVALDVDYTAPKRDGTQDGQAARTATGAYDWHITEQQLAFMPVFLYRMTALGRVVPYGGVGPRVFLLRSTVRGSIDGHDISETTEQSTKIGLGVPLGVEIALGPGALLGEALLQYGGLDHTATGVSNTGGASLSLGYRFLL